MGNVKQRFDDRGGGRCTAKYCIEEAWTWLRVRGCAPHSHLHRLFADREMNGDTELTDASCFNRGRGINQAFSFYLMIFSSAKKPMCNHFLPFFSGLLVYLISFIFKLLHLVSLQGVIS